jgi:hypothetical protein
MDSKQREWKNGAQFTCFQGGSKEILPEPRAGTAPKDARKKCGRAFKPPHPVTGLIRRKLLVACFGIIIFHKITIASAFAFYFSPPAPFTS